MKTILLLASLACVSLAAPVSENDVSKRFIEVIGGDDQIHTVDLEEEIDNELLEDLSRHARNRYLLFTRSNPSSSQVLVMNNADSIRSSNFNRNHATVVVAHGWASNHNTNLNPAIRNALLSRHNVNVIILDWSHLAMSSYALAISGLPNVGRGLGQFLAFLSSVTGASLQSMHLVGFSLGSHVVGNAGKELNGRVGRVTGLDPVSPVWENNRNALARTDGIYVEIIHTNGPNRSPNNNVGDADFYPNGGSNQPGCSNSICNHNRSWELFAATISNNHLVGRRCSNLREVEANTCQGNTLVMGNAVSNKSGSGLYRLTTGNRHPF